MHPKLAYRSLKKLTDIASCGILALICVKAIHKTCMFHGYLYGSKEKRSKLPKYCLDCVEN